MLQERSPLPHPQAVLCSSPARFEATTHAEHYRRLTPISAHSRKPRHGSTPFRQRTCMCRSVTAAARRRLPPPRFGSMGEGQGEFALCADNEAVGQGGWDVCRCALGSCALEVTAHVPRPGPCNKMDLLLRLWRVGAPLPPVSQLPLHNPPKQQSGSSPPTIGFGDVRCTRLLSAPLC